MHAFLSSNDTVNIQCHRPLLPR